jgi:hypothetical protein
LEGRVSEYINQGYPIERRASIETMPATMLGIIYSDYLWPSQGDADDWSQDRPFDQLPDLETTVGRLLWFVAYTSNSLLNTDFRTVMQANLQKLVNRARRGTLFDKDGRGSADEASASAADMRLPMKVFFDTEVNVK